MIRLHYLSRLYKEIHRQLDAANAFVLLHPQHVLGDLTIEFEERIARVAGANYAAVVGSGSDALYYALIAENITGFVALPAQTFVATANSILRARCFPLGIDVKPNGLMDWEQIPDDIDTLNAAVWVGLFGNREEITSDIPFIEDGAQHFGAALQTNTAAYSFDPTKSFPNFGNGGAVVSCDKNVIDRVKKLRRHGTVNGHVGGHSIMSERECAEMCIKLDFFPFWVERRQEIARDYHAQLRECVDCITDHHGQVSKFVISTPYREELAQHLDNRKIETKRAYTNPVAATQQAVINCHHFLQIPCSPHMTDDEVLAVILAIKEFFKVSPFKGAA